MFENPQFFLGCMVVGATVLPLQARAQGEIPYTLKNKSAAQISGKKANRIKSGAMAVVRQRMAKDGRRVLKVDQVITGTKPVMHYLRKSEETEEWVTYGKESIADALAHWKSPYFVEPEVRFTVPMSAAEADTEDRAPLNKDNVISFNVVKFAGKHYTTSLRLRYKEGPKPLAMSFDIHDAGFYAMKFSPGPDEDGRALVLKREPVIWSLGETDKFALRETPAHEVLHCQFSPYTLAHALKHPALKKVPPSGLTSEQKKVLTSLTQAEETVVDAMSGAWLTGYLKKIGVDHKPTYLSDESRLLADKIAETTPQKIIRHYVEKGPLDLVETYAR